MKKTVSRKVSATNRRSLEPVVGPRPTTVFLRWLGNRTALAKSCMVAAAQRADYQAASRFEYESCALDHVLNQAREMLGQKRAPKPERESAVTLSELRKHYV